MKHNHLPTTKTEWRLDNKGQIDSNWAKKNRKILNYKCSIKSPHTLSFALLGKTKRKIKKKK